ncbi:Gfo/Idh/MocA family protein [Dokdonia ponticola]|uniref:Gfo/Idh/MocA family protein n=1 Tax=Dokdonia ponticola TaxID=2041041 RepID=A0ABV9HVK7_9FLAO
MNRRTFNTQLSKAVGGVALLSNIPLACAFENSENKKSLGIALVGLGTYSTYELAPSLLETKHCHLAGIVTGTPEKEKIWAEKYNIPKENIYNYETFDTIVNNDAIDIVYVVLPNAMHADFCIRAAKAGKHVICEKPMAVSVAECQAIIDACAKANVKLSVGYRLHSEPHTQEIQRMVREKTFGNVQYIATGAGYPSHGNPNPNQWRLNKALSGGGALMNMGVYAIQGAIYGTGELPISVTAQEFSTKPEYFKDTDETITAQFEFPSGAMGSIFTSHNAKADRLYASCDKGWYELDVAFSYGPLHGRTSNGNEISFPHKRQQALQMDDFALHITQGTPNKVPGSMGLRDLKIVEAIYQSIKEGGRKIALDV